MSHASPRVAHFPRCFGPVADPTKVTPSAPAPGAVSIPRFHGMVVLAALREISAHDIVHRRDGLHFVFADWKCRLSGDELIVDGSADAAQLIGSIFVRAATSLEVLLAGAGMC